MKNIRKYRLTAIMLFCLSSSILAQNSNLNVYDKPHDKDSIINNSIQYHQLSAKHEIGISIGIYPIIGVWDYSQNGDNWFSHHEQYKTDIGDTINSWLIGSFTLNYHYNITQLHAVGIQSTWAFRHITTSPTDNPYQSPTVPLIKATKRENHFYNSLNIFWSCQASYRISFKRFPTCSLYSVCSLGFILYLMDEQWKDSPILLPSGHLTLLGISLGKKNNGNIELGYGTQGTLKIGYSINF